MSKDPTSDNDKSEEFGEFKRHIFELIKRQDPCGLAMYG